MRNVIVLESVNDASNLSCLALNERLAEITASVISGILRRQIDIVFCLWKSQALYENSS